MSPRSHSPGTVAHSTLACAAAVVAAGLCAWVSPLRLLAAEPLLRPASSTETVDWPRAPSGSEPFSQADGAANPDGTSKGSELCGFDFGVQPEGELSDCSLQPRLGDVDLFSGFPTFTTTDLALPTDDCAAGVPVGLEYFDWHQLAGSAPEISAPGGTPVWAMAGIPEYGDGKNLPAASLFVPVLDNHTTKYVRLGRGRLLRFERLCEVNTTNDGNPNDIGISAQTKLWHGRAVAGAQGHMIIRERRQMSRLQFYRSENNGGGGVPLGPGCSVTDGEPVYDFWCSRWTVEVQVFDRRLNSMTFRADVYPEYNCNTTPLQIAGAPAEVPFVGTTRADGRTTSFNRSQVAGTTYVVANDTTGRTYTWTLDGQGRPLSVIVQNPDQTNSGYSVGYTYYTADGPHGRVGWLRSTESTEPMSSGFALRTRYFRYYTDEESDWVDSPGRPGQLKMVIGHEGVRRAGQIAAALNTTPPTDPFELADAVLRPLADQYFEYAESGGRVRYVEGGHGCASCGGASATGTQVFVYDDAGAVEPPEPVDGGHPRLHWHAQGAELPERINPTDRARALRLPRSAYAAGVKNDGGTWRFMFFDAAGQPASHLWAERAEVDWLSGYPQYPVAGYDDLGNTVFTRVWATRVLRNARAQVTEVNPPGSLVYSVGDDSFDHYVPVLRIAAVIGPGETRLLERYDQGTQYDNDSARGYVKAWLARTTPTDAIAAVLDGGIYVQQFGLVSETEQDANLSTTWGALGSAAVDGCTPYRPIIRYVRSPRLFEQARTWSAQSDPSDGYITTTREQYAWSQPGHPAVPMMPIKQVVSPPVVSTARHGSGLATSTVAFQRATGQVAYVRRADGTVSYTGYEDGRLRYGGQDIGGQVGELTEDAPGVWAPAGLALPAASVALHYTSESVYGQNVDHPERSVAPDGRVTRHWRRQLADGRLAILVFPREAEEVVYGPARYSVINLAGREELSCTLTLPPAGTTADTTAAALWVGASNPDALSALSVALRGDQGQHITAVTTHIYDGPGTRLVATRSYHALPELANWPGVAGTHYDETRYGHDPSGRVAWTQTPDGTIEQTRVDALGRVLERWIGTSDAGDSKFLTRALPDAEPGASNMRLVEQIEYDHGGVGNGHVTRRVLYPTPPAEVPDLNGTLPGDARVTAYTYDWRGRMIVQENPEAPHQVFKYDWPGRVVAAATYASVDGFTAATDCTTTSSGRLSLSENLYDELGRVYRSFTHAIDQATGAVVSGGTLETNNWYDEMGRLVKSTGPELSKTAYDRLGRPVRAYTLAACDDPPASETGSYAAAKTVEGDVVLEDSETVYDDATKSGNQLLRVRVSRHAGADGTLTGPLNQSAAADRTTLAVAAIKGRAQVSATWYDPLDRPVTSVDYGDPFGEAEPPSTFARPSAAPARPDPDAVGVALMRSDTIYDGAGRVSETVDPRAIRTRTLYDAAGRTVAEVRNQTTGAGNLTTEARANDLFTRHAYTNGHMTAMWVDTQGDDTDGVPPAALTGADTNDQVTTYTYGSAIGDLPLSNVARGDLLVAATYPPQFAGQAATARVVSTAYNGLGEPISTVDQNGTRIRTDYDDLGRPTARRVEVAGSGIDERVGRIQTAYTLRGQVQTVTQYSTAYTGTELDQVAFAYDAHGLLSRIDQDHDGPIETTGGNAFTVEFTHVVAGTGSGARQSIRRTGQRLLAAGLERQAIRYRYDEDDEVLAALVGRVSGIDLKVGATFEGADSVAVATYSAYVGSGWLAGTRLPEAGYTAASFAAGAASGDPPVYTGHLDRFNRVVSSRWTRDNLGREAFRVDLSYDAGGNIVATRDRVLSGHGAARQDVRYDNDPLGRLLRAREGLVEFVSGQPQVQTGSLSRDERWQTESGGMGLSQTGNWLSHLLDLDGSGTVAESATGVFGNANEYQSRTLLRGGTSTTLDYLPGSGGPGGAGSGLGGPAYDQAGNLVDDKRFYLNVYDAFGRLVRVKDRNAEGTPTIAEYRYDGLGHRIGWHYDTATPAVGENPPEPEPDGAVNSTDPWFHFVYDDRWRMVATYRGVHWGDEAGYAVDPLPKEQFIYHTAGQDGHGSASYIDAAVLRQRDTSTAWPEAPATGDGQPGNPPSPTSNTTGPNERIYYLQNWRADVVAMVAGANVDAGGYQAAVGAVIERITYSAYGVPRVASAANYNLDTVVNPDDLGDYTTEYYAFTEATPPGAGMSDAKWVLLDVNADGNINSDDLGDFITCYFADDGTPQGPGVLSSISVANRKGYAGYEYDPELSNDQVSMYHVRHRVYDAARGVWLKRDPLGYVDGQSLYEYAAGRPRLQRDPTGLMCGGGGPCSPPPVAPPNLDPLRQPLRPIPDAGKKHCPRGPKDAGGGIVDAVEKLAACAECVAALIEAADGSGPTHSQCQRTCHEYVCTSCPSDLRVPERRPEQCQVACYACCDSRRCENVRRAWEATQACRECADEFGFADAAGLPDLPDEIANCKGHLPGACTGETRRKLSRGLQREAWNGCPQRPVSPRR